MTLLDNGRRQVRVRLAEIDAPERGQPHGDRARQALSDLAFGRAVRVAVVDTDNYGRTVRPVGRRAVGSAQDAISNPAGPCWAAFVSEIDTDARGGCKGRMPPRQTRNVSLTPEMEAFIDGRVASGRYRSASEVVRAALRLLDEDERTRKEHARSPGRKRRAGAGPDGR